MTTTLVTGATRGIGHEVTRQLVAAGHDVLLGARELSSGADVADRLGADAVQLDVTDDASVTAAADAVRRRSGALDVLINNAGVSGPFVDAPDVDAATMQAVFDTNVFGPVRVMRAFAPLLQDSPHPVVVNVSSGLGSIATAVDPDAHAVHVPAWIPAVHYASSKAALNMLTAQYAHAYPRMRINAVDPGLTATDFNNYHGTRSVADAAPIIARMATIGSDGPTASFVGEQGAVPW